AAGRPSARASRCSGTARANVWIMAAARNRTRTAGHRLWPGTAGSAFAVDADAVEFHAVIDQAIAELLGDLALQGFQFGIDEFEHLAALHVDQVIVMSLWCGFV